MTAVPIEPVATRTPRLAAALRAWTWAVLRGVTIGVALGAGYRGWMRLISTRPEFTWDGTLFILLVATVAATGASLALTARTRWRRRWARGVARVLGTVTVLALGAGAGAIAVPSWLLAGLAWGRTSWNRWIRRGLATGAVLATVWMFHSFVAGDFAELGVVRSVLSVPVFVLVALAIAKLVTWPTGSPRPTDLSEG